MNSMKMFKMFQNALVLILAVGFFASSSEAKELSSRMGIGFRNAYSVDLPAIAAIYYPNSDYGFLGALGIDTQENSSKFALTGGIRRMIFKEDNMNFFGSVTVSMMNVESSGSTNSGFELGALVGGEFFLPGLENLGLNFETGAKVVNLSKTRFKTVADDLFRAGIFFYF